MRGRGLPHRLETVHSAHGWRYVNDSIATTPEAAQTLTVGQAVDFVLTHDGTADAGR